MPLEENYTEKKVTKTNTNIAFESLCDQVY